MAWYWLRFWVEFWYGLEIRAHCLRERVAGDKPSCWFDSVSAWTYRKRKDAERPMVARWGTIYRSQ